LDETVDLIGTEPSTGVKLEVMAAVFDRESREGRGAFLHSL